ncbi:hypothetical protein AAG570_009072 [Ranatra chinensis]|uniref:Uncharacterized protein n=1 Tax=Ranatra chinensis TaxID=642074 RepID=A0ABD0YTC0_9HEMI
MTSPSWLNEIAIACVMQTDSTALSMRLMGDFEVLPDGSWENGGGVVKKVVAVGAKKYGLYSSFFPHRVTFLCSGVWTCFTQSDLAQELSWRSRGDEMESFGCCPQELVFSPSSLLYGFSEILGGLIHFFRSFKGLRFWFGGQYCPASWFGGQSTVPLHGLEDSLLSRFMVWRTVYCPASWFGGQSTVPLHGLEDSLLSRFMVWRTVYCPASWFGGQSTVPLHGLEDSLLSRLKRMNDVPDVDAVAVLMAVVAVGAGFVAAVLKSRMSSSRGVPGFLKRPLFHRISVDHVGVTNVRVSVKDRKSVKLFYFIRSERRQVKLCRGLYAAPREVPVPVTVCSLQGRAVARIKERSPRSLPPLPQGDKRCHAGFNPACKKIRGGRSSCAVGSTLLPGKFPFLSQFVPFKEGPWPGLRSARRAASRPYLREINAATPGLTRLARRFKPKGGLRDRLSSVLVTLQAREVSRNCWCAASVWEGLLAEDKSPGSGRVRPYTRYGLLAFLPSLITALSTLSGIGS